MFESLAIWLLRREFFNAFRFIRDDWIIDLNYRFSNRSVGVVYSIWAVQGRLYVIIRILL